MRVDIDEIKRMESDEPTTIKRMSEEEKVLALQLFIRGEKLIDIAKAVGVSPSAICYFMKRSKRQKYDKAKRKKYYENWKNKHKKSKYNGII